MPEKQKSVPALPPWATYVPADKAAGSGGRPVVNVDADAMYPDWLSRLQGVPEASVVKDRYWLECAYQCMKMELQISMKTFHFEIRVVDYMHTWAQKAYPEGKGAAQAAGGPKGGRDARAHFKRLFGFVPG